MTAKKTSAKKASAKTVATSGAVREKAVLDRVDIQHNAIDDDPRGSQPDVSNRIDMNDPTKPDAEAVKDNLAEKSED